MQLAKFVKFREEKFGGVLFETQSEKVYTLNATGAAIIRAIGNGDAQAIAAQVKTQFQDPAGTLEHDVLAMIAALRQKGLIGDGPT